MQENRQQTYWIVIVTVFIIILSAHGRPFPWTDSNIQKRITLKVPISGFPHGRSDGKMLPLPAGWCRCEAGLQYWLQPPSVVRFLSVFLFFLVFLLWITPFVVCYFSHPYSGYFHESLEVLAAAIQAQSIFTDRLLVYGFLINKWPIVCGHHGSQCGPYFNLSFKQERCYKYYRVETFELSQSNSNVNSTNRVVTGDWKYSCTLEVLVFLLGKILYLHFYIHLTAGVIDFFVDFLIIL